MPAITLKEVPKGVHEALKDQARSHRRSLNQEILHCLEQIVADRLEKPANAYDADERSRWLAASEHALSRTWNNPEDDVYNELLEK